MSVLGLPLYDLQLNSSRVLVDINLLNFAIYDVIVAGCLFPSYTIISYGFRAIYLITMERQRFFKIVCGKKLKHEPSLKIAHFMTFNQRSLDFND